MVTAELPIVSTVILSGRRGSVILNFSLSWDSIFPPTS